MDFSLFYANHLKLFFPEIFLVTSIFILTLHATFIVTDRSLGFPLIVQSFLKLCILVLFFTIILLCNNFISNTVVYQDAFIFDFLTNSGKVLILLSTVILLWISEQTILRQQINNFEYLILILCAVLGLMFLITSYDLISLYLSIEMQSLCCYVLAASKKDSSFSTEAGLKYFILGSFSSILLLFGISYFYGFTGTTNFSNLTLLFSGEDWYSLVVHPKFVYPKIMLFIFFAFFFKIAAAPVHMWSPDVYEGAPTSSTIFFSIIPKIALFVAFIRFFNCFHFNFLVFSMNIYLFFAIFSIILGTFTALNQKKLKRFLAYSSISHVGYMLLALATVSIEGVSALFFYLSIYMLTSFCIWAIVISLDTRANVEKPKTLADYSLLAALNPGLGLFGLFAFFSLAGVPPLAGFFAKIEIFISAIYASFTLSCVFLILITLISSFMYIRIIKIMYFEKQKKILFSPLSRACSIIIGITGFFLVYFFFNPSLLLLLTHQMSLCLF